MIFLLTTLLLMMHREVLTDYRVTELY